MRDFNNERDRYGSSRFTDPFDPALKPHFIKTPDSLFVGFIGKRALYWNGMGGVLLTAGARAGKLRDLTAFQILPGQYDGTLVLLDMKWEQAAISQNQTLGDSTPGAGKPCIYWNPVGGNGLPQHRINPVDFIRKDSPTLVSDVKMFVENMIVVTGASNADYFERRGREFLEAIILTIVELDGVLTLPRLYEVINRIPGGGQRWLDFAFEMSECGFAISRRIEEEIAESRSGDGDGMRGILGEIFKSFAALSDPLLMDSVSPPYDFSLKQLCGKQPYNLYLMPELDFADPWGCVVKAFFVAARVYKSRAPQSPRQTWILDECAHISSGGFPLIVKLFTVGAGIGIRPVAVFQSAPQMKALGPDADTIITSSAAVRISFGIRDEPSASRLARELGSQTLEYNDTLAQSRAAMAKKEAVRSIVNGGDPIAAGLKLAHYREAATHRSKQKRMLRTPDEILHTPENKMYVFMDGVDYPIYADRRPYYEERSLAGKFFPNPYHPPIDKVRVKTWLGHRWRRVITEPVPEEYAHLPQYANGEWSYVEGYQ